MDTQLEDVGLETKTCPIDTSCVDNTGDHDFDCSICYQVPLDPVVTLCCHLFCWPCLYKWLHTFSQSNQCPICKNHIEENSLVPIFGKGRARSSSADYSSDIPSRPIGCGKIRASSQTLQSYTCRLARAHELVNAVLSIVFAALSIYYFFRCKTTLSSSSSIESFKVGASTMAGTFMFGAGYAMSTAVTAVIVTCLDIRLQRWLRHMLSVCQDYWFRLLRN